MWFEAISDVPTSAMGDSVTLTAQVLKRLDIPVKLASVTPELSLVMVMISAPLLTSLKSTERKPDCYFDLSGMAYKIRVSGLSLKGFISFYLRKF